MCDTAHLDVDVDELRVTLAPFKCAECDEEIPAGDEYRHIEGVLDDGSPGRYLYRAHDECYQFTTYEHEQFDGCFQYGRVEIVK